MRGHVDPEALAEFREELLSRRRARRVAAHLAHCTQCAGLDARLAGLPTLLARAPAPPMPDALTTRIEAAIAAEAAARAAAPQGAAGAELAAASATRANGAEAAAGTGDADGAARGRAARGRRGREPARDRSRLALRIAAAAAAVAVVGGGGYGVSRLFSAPAPTATASGVPAAHAPNVTPGHGRGTSRMGSKIAGSSEPAIVPSNGTMRGAVVTSRTNFLPGRLRAQVERALAQAKQAVEPAPRATFTPPASLPGSGCLNLVTEGRQPLLVDHARYAGKPATVIVFPDRPGVLRAVVVGPGCSATTADQLASTTVPS